MSRREYLEEQIREVGRDLYAFSEARDTLQRRLLELDGTPRYDFLHEWAGFQAVMNTLIMAITRCEGLVEDLKMNLEKLPPDAPQLKLVRGAGDGH